MNEIRDYATTEIVSPEDRLEYIAIRKLPGEDFYFVKSHGGKEYSLEYSLILVNGVILEAKEITKKEYEDY